MLLNPSFKSHAYSLRLYHRFCFIYLTNVTEKPLTSLNGKVVWNFNVTETYRFSTTWILMETIEQVEAISLEVQTSEDENLSRNNR